MVLKCVRLGRSDVLLINVSYRYALLINVSSSCLARVVECDGGSMVARLPIGGG